MWGLKFGFVFKNSLKYPFKHFNDVKGLYFITALFLSVTETIMFLLSHYLENMQQTMQLVGTAEISILSVLIILLSILSALIMLPISVAVIRNVIGHEQANPNLVGAMFAKRQLLYLWAQIKFIIVSCLPILLVIIFLGITGNAIFDHLDPTNVDASETVGALVWGMMLIAVFISFFLVVRLMFAPVFAALDRGTSLKDSFNLTSGNWWLIFLSMMAVLLVIYLLLLAIIFPAILIFAGLAETMGTGLFYLLGFAYGFGYTFIIMPLVALSANLYLVMKSKDQVAGNIEKL